jgi:DNA-binding CsgD family transcriptional regulator
VLYPAIVQRLLAQRAGKPGSPLARLTDGERDVLRLMAEGRSNAGIAADTHLATGTVEKRIAAVFLKLGLEDRGDSTAGSRRCISTCRTRRPIAEAQPGDRGRDPGSLLGAAVHEQRSPSAAIRSAMCCSPLRRVTPAGSK